MREEKNGDIQILKIGYNLFVEDNIWQSYQILSLDYS